MPKDAKCLMLRTILVKGGSSEFEVIVGGELLCPELSCLKGVMATMKFEESTHCDCNLIFCDCKLSLIKRC